ncbi:MAG: chromosomal replication initiator protein DnaA [Candidatus Shapirobacteria bacterium]
MDQSIWKKVKEELKIDLSNGVYKVYIEPTTLISLENNFALIGCPFPNIAQVNQQKYYSNFKTALDRHTSADNNLKFEVSSLIQPPSKSIDSTPLFSFQKSNSPSISALKSGLHPKYTFDQLVVGNSNNFAYAAAQGIVRNPGLSYNPFFIWGGVGVGKTHLMQAIGHEMLKNNPDLKMRYFPAETFGNDLIAALKTKNMSQFKDKYRQLDCILVDDIQFISGKDFTQEEFFHTFNTLHMAGKQVILTSDRKPNEIKGLEDRLVSRFMGGLTVDIQSPDFEMRCAIIQDLATKKGSLIDPDAVNFLAQKIETNTRELEGKVSEVAISAQSKNLSSITLEIVESAFNGESLNNNSRQISEKLTPRHLISVCARHFNIKTGDLIGNSRKKELVLARHITAYLLLTQALLPLEEVGHLLGDRDHTSIMHARDKVNTSPQLKPLINQIIASL